MPVEVIMPKVDMDMSTGTLATWHVVEGEKVEKGAALFDIETDKAAMEVDSPASGRLHHIRAEPGAVVAVGAPVAWIYAEGETVGEAPDGSSGKTAEAAAVPDAEVPPTSVPSPSSQDASATASSTAPAPVSPSPAKAEAPAAPIVATVLRATPAARRLAREHGITLDEVEGTGPGGRIQGQDVLDRRTAAAPPVTPEPAPAEVRSSSDPAAEPRRSAAPSSGALHVARRAGRGTPLFLLHGFAADGAGWAPLERALPADMPLIKLDLPSHGRSERQSVSDFRDLARAVVSAFDSCGAERVHLLGHSLGGALALALADIRPRQIESLTLLSPAGLGPEIDGAALSGIARASRAESLAPWMKRLTGSEDRLGWDFVKAAMLARIDPDLRAAQCDLADTLFPDGVQAFDLRAALARVEAPTAIVWGRKDKIIPWKHALGAKGEIALHLLHDVGHIPHVEVPEKVARIVAQLAGRADRSD